MSRYKLGDMVRLAGTFRSGTTKEAVDPTSVVFTIRPPSGDDIVYVYGEDNEVVRRETGSFYLEFVPVLPGIHTWQLQGSGAAVALDESSFSVKRPSIS